MGISQWIDIQNLVTTGKQVSDRLTAAFSNIDAELTKIVTIEQNILNNTNQILAINERESVFASLVGQDVPTYSLSAISTPIDYFTTSGDGNFVTANKTLGTITPATTGWYRVSFMASMSFTSASATRTIGLDLINTTDTTTIAQSNINIPKDAIHDAESLSAILQLTGGKAYRLDISSSVDMDITFDTMNFAVELVSY